VSAPVASMSLPKAVWAVAFACVIAFMGIGLVDPILPAISADLGATPAQTMLLFTSYLLVTGLAMFFTSFVSSRIGAKRTLLVGLALIVIFAALAGASDSAVILYEAALGLGIAVGPLLGGALGSISWRGPFFGTAALMAIALIALTVLLGRDTTRPEPVALTATFRALQRPALLTLGLAALFYNFGFFSLLAWSPFPLEAAAHAAGVSEFGAHELGLIFCGWGIALAITSVFVAPLLTRRFGRRRTLYAMLGALAVVMAVLAVNVENLRILIIGIVVGGLFLGVMNTVLTESVMEATDLPRAVASSTYSGVRFVGGAAAPALAGVIAGALGYGAPYWIGCAGLLVAAGVLFVGRAHLARIDHRLIEEGALDEAAVLTAADA
jgi:ACDE family multidrug resistance protein